MGTSLTASRPGRALVAGVGNVFQSDDGFGIEVVRRLGTTPLGLGVEVIDFGIRSVHLAYTICDGEYETVVIVDAAARGGPAGTVYAIEPDLEGGAPPEVDGHALTPSTVMAWVQRLGGSPSRIIVVGCEPACVDEGIGLSPAVASAIEPAIGLVRELLAETKAV